MHEMDPRFHDQDPTETEEWHDSLQALLDHKGPDRANFVLGSIVRRARLSGMPIDAMLQTPYVNTIHVDDEPEYPGDVQLELRIRRYIRWNAVAMVMRANSRFAGLGGHLASYASAATLYEVGFNHVFRGKDHPGGGDQIFFQGHASPGIYGRAFLEGRLTRDQLAHFRREVVRGKGLSSYPHPWLMPDFWEFPTVSMGLGPLHAIYQARFNRYLHHRGIKDTSEQRVFCFMGDGESDEPESLGALHLASRERLGNLIFVVNCNLQRLDGPVRGNGKIIQELEGVFRGAGWNVIKVVWGSNWDELLAEDHDGRLVRLMEEVVDGMYQKLSVETGAYVRETFFGHDPKLAERVAHLTDEELRHLRRGGHDFRKVYAAYAAAQAEPDRPTVILAKTVKGWTLGEGAMGRNIAHQAKKLGMEELRAFRDLLELDIADDQLKDPPIIELPIESDEVRYLRGRRAALGGGVPRRVVKSFPLEVPDRSVFARFFKGSGDQEVSTTGAFARMLALLLDDKGIGKRVVPIIPDEARTFGLNALFRKFGIYSSVGQLYTPVDAATYLYYRESKDGQVLQEGICEAGAMASFMAAGTSYSTHGQPMLPIYIFYSMFGYQRIGDQAWAFGDARGRGFLIGATAGRTTLNGEGLQHQDGHSILIASTNPTCMVYDPSFAYEIAVIIQEGLRRMLHEEEDVYYYVTVENEAYPMPAMPEGAAEGILKGLYQLSEAEAPKGTPRVQLMGCGSILNEVIRAREILAGFGVAADLWSATSYTELRRDALRCERWNRFHPGQEARVPYVTATLAGAEGPVIAASDYMKLVADQIGQFVPNDFVALGTDGFGRSDTREALREHFEVSAEIIAFTALSRLAHAGTIDIALVQDALTKLEIDADKPDPAHA